jgi:uncharacterized protein (DUF302 family)
MIKVQSSHVLEHVESVLSRAAQRNGASLIAVTPISLLVKEAPRKVTADAISFTVCQTDLYAALLSADIRFAAFLPCRIAAIRAGEGVTLETIPPTLFCRHLNRPDLVQLAGPLESFLLALMEDAAKPASASHPVHLTGDGALGAHETQVSMRASIPQRIDRRGTKIEDLAGTGKLDAPGG